MTKSPLILGVGEILWDLLPGGKKLGGAPANFAYHASALGARGLPVSAVGDDAAGREIIDHLLALNLEHQLISVDRGHPTGTVDVQISAGGHPKYVIHENVAWDFVAPSPSVMAMAREARAICFGTLAQRSPVTRATIHRLIAEVSEQECLRVFDINLRQHFYSAEQILESLKRSSILKLNDEELPVVLRALGEPPGTDERHSLKWLRDEFGLSMIALTRGGRGSLLLSGHHFSEHPGYAVEVVDSVGAGDAFTAALVVGVLRGDALEVLHDHASRVASYVCTQSGATPVIPEYLKK